MSKPDKLPRDIKQECLWIVRGYDRRRKAYLQQQRDILEAGGENYVTYKDASGDDCRAYMPHGFSQTRDVEDRQTKLEALEQTLETRKMRAVEYAMSKAGLDLPKVMRRQLCNSIILNCKDRHTFPYSKLNIPSISRDAFYERKDLFLLDIAKFLDMI